MGELFDALLGSPIFTFTVAQQEMEDALPHGIFWAKTGGKTYQVVIRR